MHNTVRRVCYEPLGSFLLCRLKEKQISSHLGRSVILPPQSYLSSSSGSLITCCADSGVFLSQSNCRVISSSPAPPLRSRVSRQVRRQTATGTKWAVADEAWKRIKAFCTAAALSAHAEKVHTSVHIKSQQELLVQAK